MKRNFGFLMATVLVASCGGGDDSSTADRPPIVVIDAGDEPDAGGGGTPDAAPHVCLTEASFGAAMITDPAAFFQRTAMTGPPDLIAGGGSLNQDMTPDVVQLELYKGFTVFSMGEIVPGTYNLTGQELNYATCGVCVRIFADVDGMGASTQQYFATGGTVTVTAAGDMAGGGDLTYSLSNIQLEEVTINPMTFMSTPVPGGCTTSITSAAFSAPIMAAP